MINLLKIDLYKLFKSKSFYIILSIAIVLTTLQSVISSFLLKPLFETYLQSNEEIHYAIIYTFQDLITSLRLVYIYSSILAVLFFCGEFSWGTIKNIASKGYSRLSIYISKILCMFIATTIYFFAIAVSNLIPKYIILGKLITKNSGDPKNLFIILFFSLLMSFALIVFSLFLASIIRKTGATIGAILGTFLILPFLLLPLKSYMTETLKLNYKISDFIMSSCLSELSNYLTTAIPGEILTRWIIIIASYFVICSTLGIYLFKKRDI